MLHTIILIIPEEIGPNLNDGVIELTCNIAVEAVLTVQTASKRYILLQKACAVNR